MMQGTIFQERWWLDAASNGMADEAIVKLAGRVVGRLAYLYQRRYGFRFIGLPPLTHVLGPLIDAGPGKPETRLRTYLSIIQGLLEQLPPADSFMHCCEASPQMVLAFQQCGYLVKPQCNFRLPAGIGLPALLEQMNFKTRGHIHRAEKDYTVSQVSDPSQFVEFYRLNMVRTGRTDRVALDRCAPLWQQCRAREAGEIISVCDRAGSPAAMSFLVWDRASLYYLLATRAPDASSANAANLLVWSAIRRAQERGLAFDFDGIVHSGQLRFFLGFGAQLTSRLIITRTGPLYSAARFLRRRMVHTGARDLESAIFT
ncbi:MAG TPA: GNAT family N-acetyltransferase [Steroidobacteraceae bacterium]